MIQNVWFSKLWLAAAFLELSSLYLAMWCLNNFSWLLRNTQYGELIIKEKFQKTWTGFAFMLFSLLSVSLFSLDLDSTVLELLQWDSLSKCDKEFMEVFCRKISLSSRWMDVTLNLSLKSLLTIVRCLMEQVLNQLDHILKPFVQFLLDLRFAFMRSVTCFFTVFLLSHSSFIAHTLCGDTSQDSIIALTLIWMKLMNLVMKWFQTSKQLNHLVIWKLLQRNMKTYSPRTLWERNLWTCVLDSCLV